MAFTGSATVVQISDREVVITGLSLASAAAGTIGLFHNSGSPGVRLPEAFKPQPFVYGTATVSLSSALEVTVENAATGVATAIPISIVKSGTTELDWLATLTNTHGSLACPNQEIRIKFH